MSAWFDASDISTIVTEEGSSDVITWANKLDASVKMHGSTQKPNTGASINGLNALNFDFNSSGYERMFAYKNLTSPWSAASIDGNASGTYQDVAVFILYQIDHYYPNAMPFGLGWNGHFIWGHDGGGGGVGTLGSFYLDTPSRSRISMGLSSAGTTQVVSINYSNTKSERAIYHNGILKNSSSSITVTNAEQFNFPNSHHPDITPNPWGKADYTLGEILVVNEVISNEDRQKIEGYLASKWGLADQLPDSHLYSPNHLFSFDENGSLRTNRSLDYEVDEHNYTVNVEVLDDRNASYYEDFNITLTNVVEDLDGDGTEDYYDDDIDGDGLTNDEEVAYNSDPWDASSSNRPPSDINASNLTIAENSAIGTVIGEFNATDPDGEGNFTYAMHFDSLAIWLPFDETNGTTTQNHGSFSTIVSLLNGAVFSTDEAMFGSSSLRVPISSPNARVELSTPIALGNGGASNPYSVSAWFKGLYAFSETVHGWRTLIRGSTNNHHIIINKESDEIGIHRDAWFGSGKILSPISSESNWQHLVATFDGSKTTFYIDGNLLGSVQKSPGLDIKSIGNFWGGNQHFAEYLDDFRVYSKVLSQSEISSLYHFSVDQNGTLTANQPFDYETFDQNQTLAVRAFDDHNATFDKTSP